MHKHAGFCQMIDVMFVSTPSDISEESVGADILTPSACAASVRELELRQAIWSRLSLSFIV